MNAKETVELLRAFGALTERVKVLETRVADLEAVRMVEEAAAMPDLPPERVGQIMRDMAKRGPGRPRKDAQ